LIKIFFIGIFLITGARAQSLGSLLGQSKPTDIKVRWNCPQHKYPQLKQLRESAEVRVRFVERNGVLTTELKPDILKVNPLSLNNVLTTITGSSPMTVDYSDCLETFKRSLVIAIDTKKESTACQAERSASICQADRTSLMQSAESRIENSPYLLKAQSQSRLPRALPLEARGLEADQVNSVLQKFRRGQELEESELYSKEVFDFLSQRTGYLTQPQLESYQQKFKEYRLGLQKELCDGTSPLCTHIRETLAQAEATIDASAKRQIESLKNFRDSSLIALNAPLDEKEAIQQFKELLEATPFDCNFMNLQFKSGNSYHAATNFPEAMAKNMELFSQVANAECVAQTLQSLSVTMSYRPELQKDFAQKCEKDWTQACVHGLRRKELMESNLRALWKLNFGSRGEEFLEERGGLSCTIEQANPEKTLAHILADHRKSLACLELKPGETKPVNYRDGVPSGLSGDYVLKKKANGDHEVVVNVDVTADAHGVSKDEMHSRIKTCMQEASPFMKGPDGNKLDFTILTPAETLKRPASERPGVNQVAIQAPGSRSHSRSYKADIDCATIAHEVLHLLGLCDEYDGNMDGYTCRAVAQETSIMSNQHQAYGLGMSKTHTCECRPGTICERVQKSSDEELKRFYLQPSVYTLIDYRLRNEYCEYQDLPDLTWSTLPQKQTVVITQQSESTLNFRAHNVTDYPWPRVSNSQFKCRCPASENEECQKNLKEIAEQITKIDQAALLNCPSGSNSKAVESGERLAASTEWNEDGFRFVQKARIPSLLHPSHYERIVGGACASKATKYNECAVWAYRNKEQTNNCADRPEHCANGKEFLGLKP
jgi:hypothetical protein